MASTNSASLTGSPAEVALPSAPANPIKLRRGRPRLDVEPRRQRILAAAAELFIKLGYDATTLDAVSKAASVTKRAIYELVGDKVALFQAVCKKSFAARDAFRPSLPERSDQLQASLEAIATRLIAHSLSDAILTVARAMVIEGIRFPELALDVLDSAKRQIIDILAEYFDGLSACRFIGPIDTIEAADVFYDLAVGARGFRKAMGYREPLPDEAAISRRVGVFIKGYLTRPAPVRPGE